MAQNTSNAELKMKKSVHLQRRNLFKTKTCLLEKIVIWFGKARRSCQLDKAKESASKAKTCISSQIWKQAANFNFLICDLSLRSIIKNFYFQNRWTYLYILSKHLIRAESFFFWQISVQNIFPYALDFCFQICRLFKLLYFIAFLLFNIII